MTSALRAMRLPVRRLQQWHTRIERNVDRMDRIRRLIESILSKFPSSARLTCAATPSLKHTRAGSQVKHNRNILFGRYREVAPPRRQRTQRQTIRSIDAIHAACTIEYLQFFHKLLPLLYLCDLRALCGESSGARHLDEHWHFRAAYDSPADQRGPRGCTLAPLIALALSVAITT